MGNQEEDHKTLQVWLKNTVLSRSCSQVSCGLIASSVFFHLTSTAHALSCRSLVVSERICRFRFCNKTFGLISEFSFFLKIKVL